MGRNEIPVCFVKDEGDVSGLGNSANARKGSGAYKTPVCRYGQRVRAGLTGVIASGLSVESNSQSLTFG
jgi:hypothetical protein